MSFPRCNFQCKLGNNYYRLVEVEFDKIFRLEVATSLDSMNQPQWIGVNDISLDVVIKLLNEACKARQ